MRPRLLTLFALVVLAGAGCGSAAAPIESGTAGATPAGVRDQGVKFSDCVREHGVSDFPDPDAKGDYDYGVSVTPEVWTRAVDACKALKPPGALSSKRTPKEQTAGLRFARCMREKGVKDFPDPIEGEPLINTYRIPSSNAKGGMTILNATIAKCRTLLERAAAGR